MNKSQITGIQVGADAIQHGLDSSTRRLVRQIVKRGSKETAKHGYVSKLLGERAANDDAPETANDNHVELRIHHCVQHEADEAFSSFKQHAELNEAHAIAEQVTRAMIRDLLPASAMLYVPADEWAAAHHDVSKAVQHMVKEVHAVADKATPRAHDFCRETFIRDIKKVVHHHIKGSKKATDMETRHNPAHHHPSIDNKYAPETGIMSIAQIVSRFGGIDNGHGQMHYNHY